ncbi:UNVERIFIED_CONTAM: hypothetical protein Sindi_1895900, partial [Sesamum indicum]
DGSTPARPLQPLIGSPPTRLGESSSDVVSEEVLHHGGSANDSVTQGDNIEARKAGVDPPTGAREAPATTCRD